MRIALATDLDGTFLGGSDADRAALYGWLAERRRDVALVFVTGRGLSFISQLCEERLGFWPDHVIANVGTTAVSGTGFAPIAPVENWIDGRWSHDAPGRIARLLADHDGLEPQPDVEGRRVSYFYREGDKAEAARRTVERHGFDGLISDNRFFDVLPQGVQKGPTLLRTIEALGWSPSRVLVAGDTLNDLSMFETGLRGVAVSNSEPRLAAAVRDMAHVHKAARPGAAGVLEALAQFWTERSE